MKKRLFIVLGTVLMLGMASCSKDEFTTTSNSQLEHNSIKANQSENFASTHWVAEVDTTFDLGAMFGDTSSMFAIPVEATFTLDFNATGDTVMLGIAYDSGEVVFVTFEGQSTTIPFAFNYDMTENLGTMEGTLNEVTNGDPISVVLNFTYNVTNNTMAVTMPFGGMDTDPMSMAFLSLFEHLVFELE